MGNQTYNPKNQLTSSQFQELFSKFAKGKEKIPLGRELKFIKSICHHLGIKYLEKHAREILRHVDPDRVGLDLKKSKEFFLETIEDTIKLGEVNLSYSMAQSKNIQYNKEKFTFFY